MLKFYENISKNIDDVNNSDIDIYIKKINY